MGPDEITLGNSVAGEGQGQGLSQGIQLGFKAWGKEKLGRSLRKSTK